MKESAAYKTARAYRKGANDAFKQARQQARQEVEFELEELRDLVEHTATQFSNFEFEELRELVASQAKTVESLHAALDRFADSPEDA